MLCGIGKMDVMIRMAGKYGVVLNAACQIKGNSLEPVASKSLEPTHTYHISPWLQSLRTESNYELWHLVRTSFPKSARTDCASSASSRIATFLLIAILIEIAQQIFIRPTFVLSEKQLASS